MAEPQAFLDAPVVLIDLGRRQFPVDPDCNVAGQNRHCARVHGRGSCRLEVRHTGAAQSPLLSLACDPGMGLRQGTAYQ
jgi:hypothetical protein